MFKKKLFKLPETTVEHGEEIKKDLAWIRHGLRYYDNMRLLANFRVLYQTDDNKWYECPAQFAHQKDEVIVVTFKTVEACRKGKVWLAKVLDEQGRVLKIKPTGIDFDKGEFLSFTWALTPDHFYIHNG